MIGGLTLTGFGLYAIHANPSTAQPEQSFSAGTTSLVCPLNNPKESMKDAGTPVEATFV
jgi:hypothetical protein